MRTLRGLFGMVFSGTLSKSPGYPAPPLCSAGPQRRDVAGSATVAVDNSRLHLAHNRAATDAASRRTTAAGHAETGKDGGYGECEEAEEQERRGRLGFSAAAALIVGAVGDVVVLQVRLIAAAVHTQLRRQRHGAAEPEQNVQDVEGERDEGQEAQGLPEGGGNEEDEREHGEDGNEHLVINHRRRAMDRFVDHVAHDGHDEEGPEELEASHEELEKTLALHCKGCEVGRSRRTGCEGVKGLSSVESVVEVCLRWVSDRGADRAGGDGGDRYTSERRPAVGTRVKGVFEASR